MRCLLCGKDYIALGVHLRHKHAVDPDDYRDEFGILRTTPLVDDDLSTHLSAAAHRRLEDPDHREEVAQRCRENAAANKGMPGPGMTRAGKAALAKRNAENNVAYLKSRAPKVAAILREKKTLLDVRRAIGMNPKAVKAVVKMGEAAYSKDTALVVATQRRVASRMSKAKR